MNFRVNVYKSIIESWVASNATYENKYSKSENREKEQKGESERTNLIWASNLSDHSQKLPNLV